MLWTEEEAQQAYQTSMQDSMQDSVITLISELTFYH
jgi:hypothetical protein